jgi:redox-sensitive bicupin YhaK (pirin superfamily)
VRLIAGAMYGAKAPLETTWDTLFADATLAAGARLPVDADYEERAIYVVSGAVEIAGDRFGSGQLLVLRPGDRLSIDAVGDARVVLVGGAPMDGPRHIWWNFVSSRKERIEAAKADWKSGRFEPVPGDAEFIPLPEG